MQHSPALAQGWPLGLHCPPQIPPAHTPEQQSAGAAQVCPFATQPPPPQSEPSQTPVQHSAGAPHATPSCLHVGPEPHAPASHVLLQHSPGATHANPSALQVGAVHCPSTHSSLQQDVPKSQSAPTPRQVVSQDPDSHTPEQHSAGEEHVP
jgi:hypothetical protein